MAKRKRAVKKDTNETAADTERDGSAPKPRNYRKKARTATKPEEPDHSTSVNQYVKMVGDNVCLRCKRLKLDCYRKRRSRPHYFAVEGMLKDFVRCSNCASARGISCIPVSESERNLSSSSQNRPSGSPPSNRSSLVPSPTPPPPYGERPRCIVPSMSASVSIPEAPPCAIDLTRKLMALDTSLQSIIEWVGRHDQELEWVLATINGVRQQRTELFEGDGEDDPLLLFSESEDEGEMDESEVEVC